MTVSAISIPLTELLLRPSTLQRFTKRGFESTDEIEESRANGGINLLASELDVSLQEAAGLIREVQGCLQSYEQSRGRKRSTISPSEKSSNGNNETFDTMTREGNADCIDYKNNRSDNDAQNCQQHKTPQHHDDGILTAYEWLQMNGYSRTRSDKACTNPRVARKKRDLLHIVTFCRSIDDLLGGGITLGEVTEISGLPGTGKTQLATQLSVLARLPNIYGGVEGRTLYIDAEGSFLPERACAMAKALYDHVQGRAYQRRRREKSDQKRRHHNHGHQNSVHDGGGDGIPTTFTTEEILDSIDVFRVHDETALIATLYSLRHYIESSSAHSASSQPSSALPIKLIVIDSIAFHFRAVVPTNASYYVQRTKTLTALAAYLGELAHQHNLAVVVINHMTTKMSSSNCIGNDRNSISIVPALGESWAHATATRLLLSKEEGSMVEQVVVDDDENNNNGGIELRQELRNCSLIKSAHRPIGKAQYRILEEGIRDVRNRNATADNHKRARTL